MKEKIAERISTLEHEIQQFEAEGQNRQMVIMQAQQELSEIHGAIQTRQGGIIELRILKENDSGNSEDL